MAKILLVGGAGYIGSHMTLQLLNARHDVVVLDKQDAAHLTAIAAAQCVQGDLGDAVLLDDLLTEHTFDAVMHFAAYIEVGESVQKPGKYYHNNVANTLVLLDAMVKHNVKNFIFSSTAATFGEPQYTPIDEQHPQVPVNPYGRSKLMVEHILKDYDHAYGLKSVCLRYFNAAGAEPQARLGECHDPETHLIPLILQAAAGTRPDIKVFGRDYDTPDGTCVRDYIHVEDLCTAHALALGKLLSGDDSAQYNLGNGQGFSVQQVIDVVREVTGVDFTVVDAERRAGDPAVLVADSTAAQRDLAWSPKYPSLQDIVSHAWAFMQTQ